ncbi:MAG TPA: enoyl-CoA hydratase-related protein [Mycobacterium sp.]|nr:enoyl-CoA hydratase-related protein [Mycobacterium sp.]
MSTGTVHYRVDSAIATLTIDDQPHRNALSRAIRTGLFDALARAEADTDVSVAILTGAGERAFCAGANLKEMAAEGISVPPPTYMPIVRRTVPFSKLLIAAVNGVAFGGGFLLAQMADLVVAADHAQFGMPEAKVGRGAPWSAPLSQMIPRRVWLQLLVTGEPIDAARAYQIGLVNEVVPAAQLMATANALAARIRDNAPLTVQASLQMVGLTAEMGVTAACDVADRLFEKVYRSADAIEGPAAFREGRQPNWQGR